MGILENAMAQSKILISMTILTSPAFGRKAALRTCSGHSSAELGFVPAVFTTRHARGWSYLNNLHRLPSLATAPLRLMNEIDEVGGDGACYQGASRTRNGLARRARWARRFLVSS
jgi:hypothetical protein